MAGQTAQTNGQLLAEEAFLGLKGSRLGEHFQETRRAQKREQAHPQDEPALARRLTGKAAEAAPQQKEGQKPNRQTQGVE